MTVLKKTIPKNLNFRALNADTVQHEINLFLQHWQRWIAKSDKLQISHARTVNPKTRVARKKSCLQCCFKKILRERVLIVREWVSEISRQNEYDFGKNRGDRGWGNLSFYPVWNTISRLFPSFYVTKPAKVWKKCFLEDFHDAVFDFRWPERKKTKPPLAIWGCWRQNSPNWDESWLLRKAVAEVGNRDSKLPKPVMPE